MWSSCDEVGSVNARIPWWLTVTAKIILSRLPFGYATWRRMGLFRHGQMDDCDYAIRIFNTHLEKTSLLDQLTGRTILELGPGDSIATAIIAAAHGARAILVDAGPFVDEDVSSYIELGNMLNDKGLALPAEFAQCSTIVEILTCCDALYYSEGLESLRGISSKSVDLIFSQAVLEHVRKREFLDTILECRRILSPNGICSHQVDLRDHIGGGLDNLRFSEKVWESEWIAKSGFYTNRIRYYKMLEFFCQAGFDVEDEKVQEWAGLPVDRDDIDQDFRDSSDEDLCVAVFDVLLRQKS